MPIVLSDQKKFEPYTIHVTDRDSHDRLMSLLTRARDGDYDQTTRAFAGEVRAMVLRHIAQRRKTS